MRNLSFLFFLFIFAMNPSYSQTTINIPADYPTIQAGIDAANNGDIVLVTDGTYLENINYKGKAITVASHFLVDGDSTHIENTIIDGSQPSHPDSGSVVVFKSGEDTTSVLCGFTITGGTGTSAGLIRAGGGIVVYYSGARINNNIIERNTIDNVSDARAGGIFAGDYNNSNIVINNNVIRSNNCGGTDYAIGGGLLVYTNGYMEIYNNRILDNKVIGGIGSGGGIDVWGPINEVYIISNLIKGNTVQVNNAGGGGIDVYDCSTNTPVIKNNVIVDNYSSYYGGGILIDLPGDDSFKSGLINSQNSSENVNALADQFLVNNTIYNNNAAVGGGGIWTYDMTSNIMNSILWGNTSPNYPQIAGTVNVKYSDVEGGWTGEGNIDDNPSFSDTLFHLSNSSPCIGAGIDSTEFSGTWYYCPILDFEGNPRPDPPGSMPDIGACESPLAEPINSVENDLSQIPEEYSLEQNYPNPFNPTTTIKYGITERTFVELRIYDILGREVELLVNEEQDAGYYKVNYNATKLASGIYLYQLKAGSFVETKKMLLLK